MKVSCPACDSKYTIADEKVLGRKVKVRCKSCGGQILINGTIPPPPNDSPDAAEGKGAGEDEATRIFDPSVASNAAAASSPMTDAAKSSPDSATKSAPHGAPVVVPAIEDGIIWSVNVSETDERSLPTHEVVAGYLSGEFAGEVYVWHDGMADWAPIPEVPQLAAAIESAKKSTGKPAQPETAPMPKQKVLPSLSKGAKGKEATPGAGEAGAKKLAARAAGAKRPQSAHDLFAATSAAGSESDVPTSEDDDAAQKMTGARNENSVLFSLDALKAGITAAPAPSPVKSGSKKAPPATPRKKLEDIMGDVASPLATGPVASPLLLTANQSLLTAPAPPPPKPKPEPVVVTPENAAAASAAAISYAKEKEKTKRLLIAAIAGIVAVGAIAGIAIAMTKSKPAPSAAVPSAPVASATVAAAAAPTPTPAATPAAPATEEAKPAESAAPESGADAKKPVATMPGKTNPPTTTTTKTETKKEPAKKEEPAGPVSSGVGSFNRDAAAQALSVAASQTSICKKPDGPTGQGKVQVTFAPSGRATTANIVAGPFGGTAVGGCVSGVFKRARVPAFSGDPVTVSKSFSIVP